MEDRPRQELEAAILGAPDLGAGQVGGQQVGGELDTGETGIQPGRQRADRAGLGQPGRTLDQQVAVGKQGDQQAFDQSRLADDFARQVIAQGAEGRVQAWSIRGGCIHGVLGSRLVRPALQAKVRTPAPAGG